MQFDCSYVSVIQNNNNHKVFKSVSVRQHSNYLLGGKKPKQKKPDLLSFCPICWRFSALGVGAGGVGVGEKEFPVCGQVEERKEEMHQRENT